MSFSEAALQELAELASQAALEAGSFITSSRPKHIERKSAGQSKASQVVTEIDRKADDIIREILAPSLARYDLALLSEEREDDLLRLKKPFFWSVDPLDGTLPFIENKPGYAVSIALVSRAGIPSIGVIFVPEEDAVYCAIRGVGIARNGTPWQAADAPGTRLSVFVDRSFLKSSAYARIAGALEQVAQRMDLDGVELHSGGGAVMNAYNALRNPHGCYFKLPSPHPGGGSLWDFAATACLFSEAGAVASDMAGNALDLNRADSCFMNHRGVLFATSEELAIAIRSLVAS